MARNNKKMGFRVGVAAAAAGLGYVYHALSQDRSVKSKLIEDRSRLQSEFHKGRSPRIIGEKLQERITAAKEAKIPDEVIARYNMTSKTIGDQPVQAVYGGELENDKPYVIYFHGGQRIDAMNKKEWAFIGQLAEALELTILVPKMTLLPDNSFTDESERQLHIIQSLVADQPDRQLYLLGYDTGAMYAVNVASQFNQIAANSTIIEKVILISPWLDATLSNPALIEANKNDYEQNLIDMQVIQRLWSQNDPLIDMSEMPVVGLPSLAILSGTYDMHEPSSYHFYKRVRAKYPKTSYYRFDRMMHSFFLENLPEAEESISLLQEIIVNRNGHKYE